MRRLSVISESLAVVLLLSVAPIRGSAAQLSTFPVPDHENSWAFGINDSGYVVGAAGTGTLLPKGSNYGSAGNPYSSWIDNIVTGLLYAKGNVTWIGNSSFTYYPPPFQSRQTTFTFATGINNAGQIVGSVVDDFEADTVQYTNHTGYLFNGNMNGISDGPSNAINNKGQIVGTNGSDGRVVYSYLLDGGVNGTYTYFPDPGNCCFDTSANSINDAGQIVGTTAYFPSSATSKQGGKGGRLTPAQPPQQFGFLYQNGTFTDLGSLGGGGSDALDINNGGKIAGYSYLSDGDQHAFLYSNGVMKDLGTLGGTTSLANAINDQGEIVGESTLADGTEVAFLYEDGKMIDLNSFLPVGSGWTLNVANDINNFGVIVGDGTFDGQERAFILDTTPEPATFALIGTGAILFGLLRKRCRRP